MKKNLLPALFLLFASSMVGSIAYAYWVIPATAGYPKPSKMPSQPLDGGAWTWSKDEQIFVNHNTDTSAKSWIIPLNFQDPPQFSTRGALWSVSVLVSAGSRCRLVLTQEGDPSGDVATASTEVVTQPSADGGVRSLNLTMNTQCDLSGAGNQVSCCNNENNDRMDHCVYSERAAFVVCSIPSAGWFGTVLYDITDVPDAMAP